MHRFRRAVNYSVADSSYLGKHGFVERLLIDGESAGLFPFDLERVKIVLSAVARALSYRDFGPRYKGEWRVFCATLLSKDPAPKWDRFRDMVSGLQFKANATPASRTHLPA